MDMAAWGGHLNQHGLIIMDLGGQHVSQVRKLHCRALEKPVKNMEHPSLCQRVWPLLRNQWAT